MATKDSLSPYNISLIEGVSMILTPSKQRLTPNLHPKQNIVVRQVILRWMLMNGLRVTKMHRALQFDQKPYMKTFIGTSVSEVSEARTKVEKLIIKVILNPAFGKIGQNVFHRSRCDVVTDQKEVA